jgi:hypothetical protein
MPLDSELLEQAKAAEARVIDAEHAAEVARCDFHRAVRRLQLAGASLRELADALGLSHQRVHQIVAAAGGSRRWRYRRPPAERLQHCSFCGQDQKHVKTMIAGPGVYICGGCVPRADAALAAGRGTPEAAAAGTDDAAGTGTAAGPGAGDTAGAVAIRQVHAAARAERCAFCGKRRYQVAGMAAAGETRICDECLRLCHEILEERLA